MHSSSRRNISARQTRSFSSTAIPVPEACGTTSTYCAAACAASRFHGRQHRLELVQAAGISGERRGGGVAPGALPRHAEDARQSADSVWSHRHRFDEVLAKGRTTVRIKHHANASSDRPRVIQAKKVIKAIGFDVPLPEPLGVYQPRCGHDDARVLRCGQRVWRLCGRVRRRRRQDGHGHGSRSHHPGTRAARHADQRQRDGVSSTARNSSRTAHADGGMEASSYQRSATWPCATTGQTKTQSSTISGALTRFI